MLAKDRSTLRNLVVAVVASSAALVVAGTTCLARDVHETDAAEGQPSIRTSAGGVPIVEKTGETTITSAELDRGASASGIVGVSPQAAAPETQAADRSELPRASFPTIAPHTHAAPASTAAPAASSVQGVATPR